MLTVEPARGGISGTGEGRRDGRRPPPSHEWMGGDVVLALGSQRLDPARAIGPGRAEALDLVHIRRTKHGRDLVPTTRRRPVERCGGGWGGQRGRDARARGGVEELQARRAQRPRRERHPGRRAAQEVAALPVRVVERPVRDGHWSDAAVERFVRRPLPGDRYALEHDDELTTLSGAQRRVVLDTFKICNTAAAEQLQTKFFAAADTFERAVTSASRQPICAARCSSPVRP